MQVCSLDYSSFLCRLQPTLHAGNLSEAQKAMNILNTYEAASGQVVNVDKSKVSYSRNVSEKMKNMLQQSLGFKAVETHDRYLGLLTFIGRSKKALFQKSVTESRRRLRGERRGTFLEM